MEYSTSEINLSGRCFLVEVDRETDLYREVCLFIVLLIRNTKSKLDRHQPAFKRRGQVKDMEAIAVNLKIVDSFPLLVKQLHFG